MVDTVTLATSAMFHEDTCWLKLFILTRHWTDLGVFLFFIILTMSTRWVRPIGMRCLLLFLCSLSYHYLIRGPCCSACFEFVFHLLFFEMVDSLLLTVTFLFILHYQMYAFMSVIDTAHTFFNKGTVMQIFKYFLQDTCSERGSNLIEIRDAAEDKWVLLQSLIRGRITLLLFFVKKQDFKKCIIQFVHII